MLLWAPAGYISLVIYNRCVASVTYKVEICKLKSISHLTQGI